MNKTILLASLWSVRKSIFFWSLGLFVIVFLVVSLYDSMAKQYAEMLVDMPAGVEAFAGSISAIGTPEGWLSVEVFSMVLPLSLAIIGVGAGASAIGREEESGTLELLLSSPISRGRVLMEKAGAVAVQLALVAASVWLAVACGVWLISFDVSLLDVLYATFAAWLLGLAFAGVALMTQAMSGSRSLALGVGAGALVVTYFASTLAPLVDAIQFVQYVSPFYYYDGSNILTQGLTLWHMAVLVGMVIVTTLIARARFNVCDISS